MTNWLKRIKEYLNDKVLSDKCGLKISDICVHESEINFSFSDGFDTRKCKKCGEYYVERL